MCIDAATATTDRRQTMTMDITHSQTNINAFLNTFAGRPESKHYNPSKKMKISENNREFVWSSEMQQGLIISILSGLPIPAFTLVNGEIMNGGNRTTTLFNFRNGEFTVQVPSALLRESVSSNSSSSSSSSSGNYIMNYEAVRANGDLASKWDTAMISIQVITNASRDQCSQIYENLNKGVQLTIGQLLENRNHRPWVAMAQRIILPNGAYPDAGLVSRVWSNTFKQKAKKEDDPRRELAFAFQVLVSAELGPQHFHSNFQRHVRTIMSDAIAPTTDRLRAILEMLDSCDESRTIPMKKKKTIFKKFIGAIIYDLHAIEMTRTAWSEKWSAFITQIYTRDMKQIIEDTIEDIGWGVPSAERNGAISHNVARFLTTLASDIALTAAIGAE